MYLIRLIDPYVCIFFYLIWSNFRIFFTVLTILKWIDENCWPVHLALYYWLFSLNTCLFDFLNLYAAINCSVFKWDRIISHDKYDVRNIFIVHVIKLQVLIWIKKYVIGWEIFRGNTFKGRYWRIIKDINMSLSCQNNLWWKKKNKNFMLNHYVKTLI